MFCYQCQETAGGKGCKVRGVCGKQPDTSARMDLLLYAVSGVAIVNRALRQKGEPSRQASHLVIDALFTTITNANFDNPSLDDYIRRAFELCFFHGISSGRFSLFKRPAKIEIKLRFAPLTRNASTSFSFQKQLEANGSKRRRRTHLRKEKDNGISE